jgi:hypothetical protein
MDKDQPNTNNQQEIVSNFFVPLKEIRYQQEIVSNFFVPLKEIRYISSHSFKLIIGNPFEGTKNIS